MAISAVGEGCHKYMEELLPQIVDAILPYINDPVRDTVLFFLLRDSDIKNGMFYFAASQSSICLLQRCRSDVYRFCSDHAEILS